MFGEIGKASQIDDWEGVKG